jgi:pimeloyl-ACP methyl ester carboxylesterase
VDAVATALGIRAAGHAPLVTAATSEGVLRVPGGALGVTHLNAGSGKPLVLLAAIPGSAAGNAGLARALAVERPVTCIDLPGFGPSMLNSGTIPDALLQAIQQLGLGNADIVACEESAGFACTLAAGMPGARIVLLNPVADSIRTELAAAMVDVTPRYDGGHLQAAWHQLRDRSLWQPWYQRDTDHALNAGTDPDVPRLQAIMTDWMRGGTQGRATLAAALDQPLSTLTSALGDRLAILSRRGHPLEQELRTLAPRFAVTGSVDDRGSGGAILHLLAA